MTDKNLIRSSLAVVVIALLLLPSTIFIVSHSTAETGEERAWPMFGGGLTNDGRTEVATKESSGDLRWNFEAGGNVDSSPAVGPDGNIYVGSADGHLYSLSPEGKKRWSFNVSFLFSIEKDIEDIVNALDDKNISKSLREIYEEEDYPLTESDWLSIKVVEKGEVWELKDISNRYNHEIRKEDGKLNVFDSSIRIDSSPAVDAEGNVYFGDTAGYFYSVGPDGTERWSKDLGKDKNVSILSSPVVTDDGSVLIGRSFTMLYSFSLNGTKEWEYNPGGFIGSTPAVDEDGRIYLGIGAFGQVGQVQALSPEGNQVQRVWGYTLDKPVYSSPALDGEGNVYFGSHDGNLTSLDPEGDLNWKYETEDIVFSSPAIGSDGTVYIGSNDNHLYAIDQNGEKKWEFETEGKVQTSPSIGSSGNIYFGSNDGRLYSLTPDGEKRWDFETDSRILSSPAIDGEGNLYFGSADHNLYSLGTEQSIRYRLHYPLLLSVLIFIAVFVPVRKKSS